MNRFDTLTRSFATATMRRRAIVGLGALALGGAGVQGLSQTAAPVSAQTDRCLRECAEACLALVANKKCFRRCRRRHCNTI
jgi:hypothetical protein